ncbi:hypothetical protein L580_0713 [Serratia fonticola AU-P3(3)]|nr:hypothetical protein L580_0713 [Serratia fonticola AU-P3(3)]
MMGWLGAIALTWGKLSGPIIQWTMRMLLIKLQVLSRVAQIPLSSMLIT